MSYAILYTNVSRRLKQLDEQVSNLQERHDKDWGEWEKVREDLVAVTRLASDLENIPDQDALKRHEHQKNKNLGEECILLMRKFTEADERCKSELSQKKREDLFGVKTRFGRAGEHQQHGNTDTDTDNTVLNIDEVRKREKSIYDYTRSQIGSYIDLGSRTLEDLSSQRSILMRARKKIINATRGLGLSEGVMRNIDRTYSQNKLITVVGIVVTITLMYLIVKILG